jgi:Na+/proline symporter
MVGGPAMIDLALVLAFVAYSVTAGMRARRKASQGLEEYFLAGRNMPGWKAGTSMAATQYAADTPLLVTGLIATGGLFALWRLWIYGLAFLMMGFLLGRSWLRARVVTDAELVEIRYSGRTVPILRALKAVYFGTVINCTVLAMVLVAAARICQAFLPWNTWLPPAVYDPIYRLVSGMGQPLVSGIGDADPFITTTNNLISLACIVLFVGLYSTTGGLRGVIATDVVQFGVAMTATLAYAVVAVVRAGGLDTLVARIGELYGQARAVEMLSLAPGPGEALLPFLTVIALQWFFQMNSDGTGYLAQRLMSTRSERDAHVAALLFTWAQIFLRSLLWVPIGVALLVVYPVVTGSGDETLAAAREFTFVQGVRDLLPVGLRGLMLTGLLAALASTVDTHLNWGASYWANDLYRGTVNERMLRREPGPREMVLVARLSNVVILGLALFIMAHLESIQTAWHVSLLFGAGIGSVLVLRWLWERVNGYSEIAAIVTSLVVAPVLLATVDAEWLKLLIMSAASTAVVIAVTLLTPRTDDAVLQAFYRRVKPPGFWGRTVAQAGLDRREPRRAFRDGVWSMLLTAGGVYLALAGAIRVLLPVAGEGRLLGAGFLVLGGILGWMGWRRVSPRDYPRFSP